MHLIKQNVHNVLLFRTGWYHGIHGMNGIKCLKIYCQTCFNVFYIADMLHGCPLKHRLISQLFSLTLATFQFCVVTDFIIQKQLSSNLGTWWLFGCLDHQKLSMTVESVGSYSQEQQPSTTLKNVCLEKYWQYTYSNYIKWNFWLFLDSLNVT